jgi:hypothetical protein
MGDTIMNDKQRLQLQNMIKANNVEDQTSLIRELKHSIILRKEVNQMIKIKAKHTSEDGLKRDEDQIYSESASECSFLFTYYTDIFNKIRKDEIDIGILNQFLDVLRKIEDGELDQHEGSFLVGSILKTLYVDSAIRKGEKLDEQNSDEVKEPPKKPEVSISWKQFKALKK